MINDTAINYHSSFIIHHSLLAPIGMVTPQQEW